MTHSYRAVGAYIFAGAFTVGVKKAGFEIEAHLEGNGYGTDSAKANFPGLPIHVGTENWPYEELAENPPDLVYCNPPCFSAGTMVITENGSRLIRDLVRERSTERVLSVDELGRPVYRRITNWHANRYEGAVYDVRLHRTQEGGRGPNYARATANHRFLTDRGWIPAAELGPDDVVCTGYPAPNADQRALIDGMMLGDATIKKHQAQLVVQQVHHEYVRLKAEALSDFVTQRFTESEGTSCGPYTRQPKSILTLKTQSWVKYERDRWYPDGKKRVPRDIELHPATLAAWYLDDGTIRSSNSGRTEPRLGNEGYGGGALLCTDSFSEEDVDFLIEKLDEIDIEARRSGTSERAVKYPRILVTTRGFRRLIETVAPYTPSELRYKLPDWAPVYDELSWSFGQPTTSWDHVESTYARHSTRTTMYCIDVEETHNFVTFGGVAHNCAIFSTMGRATTRGSGSWRNDERLGCWKDCFSVLERIRPRALVIESVTQAYGTGRPFIDELTSYALGYGYSVSHVLMNAAYHGVPQHRNRFFFVAHEPGPFRPIEPDYENVPTVGQALTKVETRAGYDREPCDINGVEKLKNIYLEAAPGERLVDAWNRMYPPEERELNAQGKVKGRPSFQDRRLDPEKPMGAMTGDKFWHPEEPRRIGPDELKAIGGYPLDFIVDAPRREIPGLLARAVMPPVGEWIARSVKRHLEVNDTEGRSTESPTVEKIDTRKPTNSPVDLTPDYVDPKYGKPRVRATVPTGVSTTEPGPRGDEKPVSRPKSDDTGTSTPKPAKKRESPKRTTREPPVASDDPPFKGEGSGRYIQRLLLMGLYTYDDIVAMVHANYEGRKTKRSDVYYNKRKLETEFGMIPPSPGQGPTGVKLDDPISKDTGFSPTPGTDFDVGGPPNIRPNSDSTDLSGSTNTPTALVTGMTPSQCGSKRTQLKLLTSATAWATALRELGYAVDHRVVDVGEDLSGYDVVLCGLSKPNAIAAGQAFSGLYTLSARPDAIPFVDDWQVGDVLPGFQTYSRDHARIWRLDRRGRDKAYADVKTRLEISSVVDGFADPDHWPRRLVVPTHGYGGDLDRLKVPTGVEPYPIDPTCLIERWPVPEPRAEKDRRWLWASLVELGDELPGELNWHVDRFGNKGAGKGGVGKTKAADNRVKEPDLVPEFDSRWGILAPRHPDSGSGWWRVRYLMARDTGSIVSAPYADAEVFGPAYEEASDTSTVEGMMESDLRALADEQAAELDRITMPIGEAVERVRNLIGDER